MVKASHKQPKTQLYILIGGASIYPTITIHLLHPVSSIQKISYHTKMCNNMAWSPSSHPTSVSSKRRHRSKQTKVQIYRLSRKRCEEDGKKEMELTNLKLYLENRSMIEENEKLRKKANLLHQENLALMSELQNKFPHLDRFSTTLLLLLQKQ